MATIHNLADFNAGDRVYFVSAKTDEKVKGVVESLDTKKNKVVISRLDNNGEAKISPDRLFKLRGPKPKDTAASNDNDSGSEKAQTSARPTAKSLKAMQERISEIRESITALEKEMASFVKAVIAASEEDAGKAAKATGKNAKKPMNDDDEGDE